MSNKCPKCGFPEHESGECPVVGKFAYPTVAMHKDWEQTHSREPSLQLLIIDAGECCFVQVQQGRVDVKLMSDEIGGLGYRIIPHPFPELRSAIDAHFAEDKPVPRIERQVLTDSYLLTLANGKYGSWYPMSGHEYESLNELARQAGATKDLPIYEPKGTWAQLLDGHLKKSWGNISIWKYER